MSDVIKYILRFMTGDYLDDDINRYVGYTSDAGLFEKYKIVIIPSGFFDEGIYGTSKTSPSLPLENIEGIPFLYGIPGMERIKDTLVVHADLIASAYFLLSRYEEILNRDLRDEHGRFPGRESLPARAGFIDRPVVDEYGKLIRKWLHESGVTVRALIPSIRKVNLTYDVDEPFSGRTWRSVARKLFAGRNPIKVIKEKNRALELDPYYTFPWLLEQGKTLQQAIGKERCQLLLFFKAGTGKIKKDRPVYNLSGKDIQKLYRLCQQYDAETALHASYRAGRKPSLIYGEKKNLEAAWGIKITKNRHHFLTSREPEDMEMLEKYGIADDYTMGYADLAGFRLGTSFPVQYINPVTCRISSLILHPLTLMECTLSESKYMNLDADRAEEYCIKLINNIREVGGELTLLWHNNMVVEGFGYLRELYNRLIKILK